jgi:hypothetical protein
MQATTRFHEGITHPILEETDFVFHHPIAFHPTNSLVNADADRRDPPISGFRRRGELTPAGFFRGLDKGDPGQDEPLEAPILVETTPQRHGIARQLREAFIMGFAFIGRTQETKVAGLIDHEEVLERVALLFAAVVFLLVLGSGRAVEWSLSTIMPNRGGVGISCVRLVASSAVNSSAVRAGSRSGCAKAQFKTGWRR